MAVNKAKEEIIRLQRYVELAESYKADTLEKQIIKEYAYTYSIEKVAKNLNIDRKPVISTIRSKGVDELHKIVRSGYLLKTRPQRTRAFY